MTWLLTLVLMAGDVTFEPTLTLENPPEEKDLYLQSVLHIEIDDKGRFYASDFPSARIFYWKPDGSFEGTFGRKGEGPGEFNFGASLGPPMGYINVLEDKIYIYDGASRTVTVLDRAFEFVDRITFDGLGGKINNFHVLGPGRFLFYDSYFCEEKACRRALIYNEKGQLTATWRETPDDTWSLNQNNGKVYLYIWQPTLATDFSRLRGEAVIAHSSEPSLDIFSPKGEKLRTVTMDIPKKSVTQDDIDEYNAQTWLRDNDQVKPVFPDEKSYFDQILTLKDGYLVYHASPLYGIAEGYLVDWNGKALGRFRLACGEGGGLFAPRGRLMAAIVDDAGDFQLRELKAVK